MDLSRRPRVVIVGGGFGGLYAAQRLGRAPVEITVVDRRNFHLFQPLLYQVATGALSPANIAAPLRAVLKRQANTRVLLGTACDVDLAERRLVLTDESLPYDTLVVATGSQHSYFGHADWEKLAPSLKTVEDATEIRRRVLFAFEAAERETDPAEKARWLTFVIVGGGPTGVELAGALAELAQHTLRKNFRTIDPAAARIILLEGLERVLPTYPADLSEKARRRLEAFGVAVRTGTMVTDVQPHAVEIHHGQETDVLSARTCLWAAGVSASSLGKKMATQAGAPLDRAGRVKVNPDLTLPGHPEVFVIGDLACFALPDGKSLPGVAPVAIQQGRYVADVIEARLRGRTVPPFQYRDKGSLATIGRSAAVADLGWIHLSGWLAWWMWLVVHIAYLIAFENRLLVLTQWAWNYLTRNRSARLITGASASADCNEPGAPAQPAPAHVHAS